MQICIIGCGRWGSLITWYLDKTGHDVTLYGRPSSEKMARFLSEKTIYWSSLNLFTYQQIFLVSGILKSLLYP